jgi:hypothetical protein
VKLASAEQIEVRFIEPMYAEAAQVLPDGEA